MENQGITAIIERMETATEEANILSGAIYFSKLQESKRAKHDVCKRFNIARQDAQSIITLSKTILEGSSPSAAFLF